MYGVVLWSSKEDSKAVIWCEDHGDLAFYTGGGEGAFDGEGLDAGDLVSFNLDEGCDIRRATEPQLVAQQEYPGLAERLMAGGAGIELRRPAGDHTQREGTNVIAFAPRGGKSRLVS